MTAFTYEGGAAWAKPTAAIVKAKEVTYSEFRGFSSVTTAVGVGDESSSSRSEYFRGMGPDVQLTAGPGAFAITADDEIPFQGQLFSSTQLNGSIPISQTVIVPGVPAVVATNAKNAEATRIPSSTSYGFTFGASGGLVHRTQTDTTYNTHGQVTEVEDLGDATTTSDDVCTRFAYAHEGTSSVAVALAGKHMVSLVKSSKSVAADCGTTVDEPTDLISHNTTEYNDKGQSIRYERLDPTDGIGQVIVREVTHYDALGRATTSRDGLGSESNILYQDSPGGLLQSTTFTTPDPDGSGNGVTMSSTTTVNPLTGMVIATTDPNGRSTVGTYDALSRLLTVTYPQHSGLAVPSVEHEYTISPNGLNSVVTRTLGANGQTQHASVTHYDGMLRPFQYQAESGDSGESRDENAEDRGRLVSHVYYDSAGRIATQTGEWHAQGAPQMIPVVPVPVPPSQTTFEYDDAGREIAEIFWVGNDSNPDHEKWRTVTGYDGDITVEVPPLGGTPQAVVTDAHGRTVELRQYLRDPDDDAEADTVAEVLALPHQSTMYVFNVAGQRSEMRDVQNNVWTYDYDWAGRQIASGDPDGGSTTTTYNVLDQVVTRTNGNGDTLAYTYDLLGRTTSLRDDSPTGPLRVQWQFDQALDPDGQPVLGQQSSATRFVNGQPYTTSTPSYDDAYRPLATTISLPPLQEFTDALESTSFTTEYSYTADGQISSVTHPAVVTANGAKRLGSETVTTRFDTASMPSWMSGGFGWGTYVADSRFVADGRPLAADLGNTYGAVVTYDYEEGTDRLASISLNRQNHGTELSLRYGYDAAGNVTSVKDQASTSANLQDNQCFSYDGLRRLEVAWTAADGNCEVAENDIQASAVGGAAPYWTEYRYDPLGNRTGMIEHAVGGLPNTVTSAYTHGAGGAGPHQITGMTESLSGGAVTATTFAYDGAGNRVAKTSDGDTTGYTWDAEGELVSAGGDDYVYGASGNRLVRSDANGLTVYLPGGQEINIDGDEVSATRYYTFAGTTVAVRTAAGLGGVSSLVSDHQGSVIASVPNTTWTAGSVRRVRSDPFGATRTDDGTPGDHQFLGAVRDAGSGLTLLKARYYDESIGQFISVDPILVTAAPTLFNAYGYSANNPLTMSDPSGLSPRCIPELGCPDATGRIPGVHKPGTKSGTGQSSGGSPGTSSGAAAPYVIGASCGGNLSYNRGPCSARTTMPAVQQTDCAVYNGDPGCTPAPMVSSDPRQHELNAYFGWILEMESIATRPQWIQDLYFAHQDASALGGTIIGLISVGGGFRGNPVGVANSGHRAPQVLRVGDVKLSAVPSGAVGTPTQNGKGMEYVIPRGTPEISETVASVRIMDPVTSGKYQYPNGYAVYQNGAGQTINPVTGQTIANSHPLSHILFP